MQFKMTKTFAWADEADEFESRVSGEVERESETTVSWYEHVPMHIAVWDKVSDPETQLKLMIDVKERILWVNLTPHTVNIRGAMGNIDIPSYAGVDPISKQPTYSARVEMTMREMQEGTGFYFLPELGKVYNLTGARQDVRYIVSQMVMNALPCRADLYCPGDTIRDETGKIIGCKGLIRNLRGE